MGKIRDVTAEGTNAGGDELESINIEDAGKGDASNVIAGLVGKAREAMEVFAGYDQDQVNEVVQAVAWAIIKQENAEELARLAVEDTGLGNFEDKVNKNQRKNLGTLQDLMDPSAKSVGVIDVDEEKGITEIAKPVGVVAAVTPSTNPAATPANKTMMAPERPERGDHRSFTEGGFDVPAPPALHARRAVQGWGAGGSGPDAARGQ